MSDDLIAIGEDGTGDLLCYRRAGNILDKKVFLWNHETGELEELAASLREFIFSFNED